MMEDVEAIVKGLSVNARQVIRSLGPDFAPPPRQQSRQLTASVAWRYGRLIEREWQKGCAQITYYRLNPLGLRVRTYLLSQTKE